LTKAPFSIWFTGLPGSGKTTLAEALQKKLMQQGKAALLLDGDEVRRGLCADLGFSLEDRTENIRRIAELNKIILANGMIALNAFVSPTEAIRAKARTIIGEERFVLVFVDCPLSTCIARDPKGMYKKNLAEQGNNFTGLGQDFEPPAKPQIHLNTDGHNLNSCLETILEYLASNNN
jgi:adenylylsulfate kinase